MIDKRFEQYYDILISIFIGSILVLLLNACYDSPRTIMIKDTNDEHFKDIRPRCGSLVIT